MSTQPLPVLRATRDRPVGLARIGLPAMCLPRTVVPTSDVARRLGVQDGWIESRTGVHERRRAAADESLASLAAQAGRAALDRAGLSPGELDLLLVATITADDLVPNAAPLVAAALGAPQAGAMDVGAACTGFLSAIALGAGAIESGRAEHVLVIGADFMSRYTDHDDRRTAGLLGDGAGAVTLSGGGVALEIGPVVLHTDPAGPPLVYARRDDALLRMEGPETFRVAVDRISEVTLEAVECAGIALADIDVFVFHQANSRILKAVGERLDLDHAKVVDCVRNLGNTSAASIPIALCHAEASGLLRPGATVLLGAIGAGFTYGALVARWSAG
jgi:3-oxoacyl-[acyl-carrier-protein] synthase-3